VTTDFLDGWELPQPIRDPLPQIPILRFGEVVFELVVSLGPSAADQAIAKRSAIAPRDMRADFFPDIAVMIAIPTQPDTPALMPDGMIADISPASRKVPAPDLGNLSFNRLIDQPVERHSGAMNDDFVNGTHWNLQ
jgi:hypothetical protein